MFFGHYTSPFGHCLIAWYELEIYWLSFFDDQPNIQELQATFSKTPCVENHPQAQTIINELFSQENHRYHLKMHGTPFQKLVWQSLLTIKSGTTKTYEDIAFLIGQPKAIRAVANAIACNNISYLIPCHRIIRKNNSLGGYRWGIIRKEHMLKAEKNNQSFY